MEKSWLWGKAVSAIAMQTNVVFTLLLCKESLLWKKKMKIIHFNFKSTCENTDLFKQEVDLSVQERAFSTVDIKWTMLGAAVAHVARMQLQFNLSTYLSFLARDTKAQVAPEGWTELHVGRPPPSVCGCVNVISNLKCYGNCWGGEKCSVTKSICHFALWVLWSSVKIIRWFTASQFFVHTDFSWCDPCNACCWGVCRYIILFYCADSECSRF